MPKDTNRVNYLTVWVSLIVALILQVIPMPDSLLLFRPYWMAMALIYWCMAAPLKVGVFHGFIAGLFLDLLEGSPMGQNALLLSAVCFFTLSLYQRLRVYSLWQQVPIIVVITGLALLVQQWMRVAFGVSSLHIQFILPAVVSGLLWPWFFTLMLYIKRRFS